MEHLEKIKKTSPKEISKMNKPELESLITGSLREIAIRLEKLDSLTQLPAKIDSLSDDVKSVHRKMDTMEQKIKDTQDNIKEVKDDAVNMKADIDELKQKMSDTENAVDQIKALKDLQQEMDKKLDFLSKTVTYHQGMLESTDAKFRATHVIIYGVPEDDTLGETDKDRVENVIEKNKCITWRVIRKSKDQAAG